MRLWYVVESEDSPSKLEQEVGTEGHKGPEWNHRDDFGLKFLRKRHNLEEYSEVEGGEEEGDRDCLLSSSHLDGVFPRGGRN